jgi:cytochrome c
MADGAGHKSRSTTMNLELWDSYSADQQQTFAAKIVRETKEHGMPLPQYRMIHWNSRITDADVQTLANWAHASAGSAAGKSDSAVGQGDPSRGKVLFEKRCVGCHTFNENRDGPKLKGVYGRTSGSIADFAYSAAIKKAHIVWDENSLARWLSDPDSIIPGNEMDFLVSRPVERRDLIAFLRKSSGN